MPAPSGMTKAVATRTFVPRSPDQSTVADTNGTRRAALVLSTPSAARPTGAAIDWLQRTILAQPPCTTTRWRIRVANRQLSTVNQAFNTPCTVSAVYIGAPVYASSGRWTGDFTSNPSPALASMTVPTDGSDVVSPWVTSPSLQFQRGKSPMISYGITSANPSGTGAGVAVSQGGQTCAVTVGGSALAGVASIASNSPLIGAGFSLLDVRIEVEYVGSQGIIFVLGDSTAEGVSDGDAAALQKGAGPADRWPELSGVLAGNWVTNLGIGGSQQQGVWATQSNYCWQRVDWATCPPDAIIDGLGINDINNAATLASFKTNLANSKAIAAALAPGVPYWRTTILPGIGVNFAATLATAVSAGATTFQSATSIPTGQTVQIGAGSLAEVLTTTGTPSGTGPYTMTTTAAATRAHPSGDPLIWSKEILRSQINEWLRQAPIGVAGVLDFDLMLAASPGSAAMNPRFVSADLLHELRGGHQVLAVGSRLVIR